MRATTLFLVFLISLCTLSFISACTTTFYFDEDLDGYGDASDFVIDCAPNGNHTALFSGDCDEMDMSVNPGEQELCDGIDNNCDGSIDEINGCIVYVNEVKPFRTNKRSAIINKPTGMVYYDYFIYALDQQSFVIRKIDPLTGSSVIFAGQDGVSGNQNGIGTAASFSSLVDAALAPSAGEILVIDGQVVRRVVISTGAVSTLPGTFTNPQGITTNLSGRRVFIADQTDNVIYLMQEGNVIVYAGIVGTPGYTNGDLSTATFTAPISLTFDALSGFIYVGEQLGSIRLINGTNVSQFAGTPGTQGTGIGLIGSGGEIGEPSGLLFSNNVLYVADSFNHQIRSVSFGEIDIFAGSTAGFVIGTGASNAQFQTPNSMAMLPPFLFVSDIDNGVIVKIGACNGQGISTGTSCSCFNGFSGSECEITPLASCSLIPPSPNALTSSVLPVANAINTFYTADTLNFQLDSPNLVAWRRSTYDFADGSSCPHQFTVTQDYSGSCSEKANVQVPFADRVSCGFTRDNSDPDFLIWRGSAQANLRDIIGQLRSAVVTRYTIAKYKIAVRFPRTVNVTVYPLNVLSDVNLLAAITYQAVDTTVQPAVGVFSFTTSLQWPYSVNVFSLSSAPNGWTASSIVETTTVGMCANVAGSICMQSFDVFIPTDLAACDLDGNYVYSASIRCRVSDCPTLAPASITAIVDSENYCVEVDATADLSGSLAIYRDSSRVIQASNFAQSDIAYFRAQLSSLAATIESVDLVRVSYWKPGATAATVIYDRLAGITLGFTFVEETAPLAGQSYSDFNFELDQINFPQWPEDIVSFRVDAVIEATFQDTSKRSNKKLLDLSFEQTLSEQKHIVSSKNGQLAIRGRLVMTAPNQPINSDSSASSTTISMIVFASLSLLLSLFF